ncbi:Ran-binding protein 9/10 [Entomortierella parvispora]|uniref:Ran-binding protein 9/10 n=1 Tax=Entomortierella parvispora TaxID=205924 RepID=A0A9P3LUT5_9FUNG|nr:Ran-binding protein 9/10 [Entomortierella parvispora]
MSHRERRRSGRPSPEETHPGLRVQDEDEELSDADTHPRSPRTPIVRPANPTPSSSASNSTSTLETTADVTMSSSPSPTPQDTIGASGDRTSATDSASTVTGQSHASASTSSGGTTAASVTPLWPSASDLAQSALSTVSPVRHYPQLHLRSARQQQNVNHPRLPLPDREDSVSRPRSITFGTLKKASLGGSGASSSTTGASGKKSRMAVLPSYLRQTTFIQHFQPEGVQPDLNISSSGRESTKRRRLSGRRRHADMDQYEDSGSDSSGASSDSSSGSEAGFSSPENESGTSTPMPDHKPLRYQLPSRWSSTDKTDKTDLLEDDLQVFYTGPGKEDRDASAIRANRSIPPQCGVYYYEVHIKSKGQSGYIGVGVCNSTVALDRLPGWEPQSWGYHGDDGNSFGGCGNGRPFGPVFTTGDTVGCGVNFRDMSLFYTKNGTYLGVAFRDLKGTLYPTVGMRTTGEILEANFGQREFVFDIERHVKEEKMEAWQSLENTLQKAMAENNQVSTLSQSLGQLVLSYMIHHGYSESARQFSNDLSPSQGDKKKGSSNGHIGLSNGADCSAAVLDAERRKVIRTSIMTGDIDKALELLEMHYPGILTSNEDLLLQLRCRKFVEMVSSASSPLRALDNQQRKSNIGNGKKKAADTADVEMKGKNGDAMDVDMENSKPQKAEVSWDDELEGLGLLKDAIRYGQFLQEQYRTNRRQSVQDMLIDAFSVLAYADPPESTSAAMETGSKSNGSSGRSSSESQRHASRTPQHTHHNHNHNHNHHPHKQSHHHHSHHSAKPISRERVATTVNTAILVSQNLPKTAPLETVFRQATVGLSELTRQGCGEAAFFDLEHDCFE